MLWDLSPGEFRKSTFGQIQDGRQWVRVQNVVPVFGPTHITAALIEIEQDMWKLKHGLMHQWMLCVFSKFYVVWSTTVSVIMGLVLHKLQKLIKNRLQKFAKSSITRPWIVQFCSNCVGARCVFAWLTKRRFVCVFYSFSVKAICQAVQKWWQTITGTFCHKGLVLTLLTFLVGISCDTWKLPELLS